MKYYEFSEDDKFINTFKAFPQFNHYAVSGNVYFNSLPQFAGTINSALTDILQQDVQYEGIWLYEYNVDRLENFIYPFVYKLGYGSIGWKPPSELNPWAAMQSGARLDHKTKGPVTGTISRSYDTAAQQLGGYNMRASALVTASKKYRFLSNHFDLPMSIITAKELNFVYIPSIFYGSTIKRSTVKLDFYFTGSLVGTLEDVGGRGELIQTAGDNGNGDVAGLIFYDEGVIMLTGSWDINTTNQFQPGSDPLFTPLTFPRWIDYFSSINDEAKFAPFNDPTISNVSCSYGLSYQGMQNTECLTLMAHAPAGEVNYSNNPTFYTHRPQTSAVFNFVDQPMFQLPSAPVDMYLLFTLMVPIEAGGQGIRHKIKLFFNTPLVTFIPIPNTHDIYIDARTQTAEQMASLVVDAINGTTDPLIQFGSGVSTGVGLGIRQLYAEVDTDDPKKINIRMGSYTDPVQSGPGLHIEINTDMAANSGNQPLYTHVPTTLYLTSSNGFLEQAAPLTNIVSSSVQNFSASYEPTTYISKIGLYDEDKNLIGVAKLAKPIKKENRDSYTFKLKYDI